MTDDCGKEGTDVKKTDLLLRTDIWDKFHPENTRCVVVLAVEEGKQGGGGGERPVRGGTPVDNFFFLRPGGLPTRSPPARWVITTPSR